MLESSKLYFIMLLKICMVSVRGIFKCVLGIYREANIYIGSIGVCFKACIICVVFFVFNVCGRGIN